MKKTNIVMGQSGGPTPVINLSLCGAVEQALKSERIDRIYGMENGIEGLISGRLIELNNKLHQIRLASLQPGSILRSSRYSLQEEDLEKILANMEQHDITLFCYIGGNGSSRTVLKLHEYAQATGRDHMAFIHIPKTVDNDLFGTDHTPGFGSAAKFFAHAIQWVGADLWSMNTFDQVKIVESMGRNAGWLAAAGAMGKKSAGDPPHLVYLPENIVHLDDLLREVERAYNDFGPILMIVSENVITSDHNHLLDRDPASGPALRRGHPGGTSHYLARLISEQIGLKARYDAPGTFYRATVGFASRSDRQEAYQAGEHAIHFLLQGYSGGLVSLVRVSNDPYLCKMDWVHLQGIAGREKKIPAEYWDAEKHLPTELYIQYLSPLIDNEIPRLVFSL